MKPQKVRFLVWLIATLTVFGVSGKCLAQSQKQAQESTGQDRTVDLANKVTQEYIDRLANVVKANCAANQKEDVAAAIRTIHPKSAAYASTEQISKQLFAALDLNYTMTGFHFIGRDDTYAVARVKIRTSKRAGNIEFQDNTADFMITFRQDGNDWKVWSQNILEILPD